MSKFSFKLKNVLFYFMWEKWQICRTFETDPYHLNSKLLNIHIIKLFSQLLFIADTKLEILYPKKFWAFVKIQLFSSKCKRYKISITILLMFSAPPIFIPCTIFYHITYYKVCNSGNYRDIIFRILRSEKIASFSSNQPSKSPEKTTSI